MKIIFWYKLFVVFLLGSLVGYILSSWIKSINPIIKKYWTFVFLFSMAVIGAYLFVYNHKYSNVSSLSNNLSLIGQISALIFAIFVGYIAFFQLTVFLKDKEEQRLKLKKQAIFTIKPHLANVGWWTGLNDNLNTEGYKPENRSRWEKNEFRTRVSILHSIHAFEYTFIKNASLLPGFADLEEHGEYEEPIPGLLAGYLQWCKTFNDYLYGIKQFILSYPVNLEIYIKIIDPNVTDEDLTAYLNTDENKKEKQFFQILIKKYTALHFDIIGCEQTQHLYHYHKELTKVVDGIDKKLHKDWNKFYKKDELYD